MPAAVTLEPMKLRVVAAVDKELPSSCIVMPDMPPPLAASNEASPLASTVRTWP